MDPAADFLAREQEQLGELDEEIGSLSGGKHEQEQKLVHQLLSTVFSFDGGSSRVPDQLQRTPHGPQED